MFIEPLSYKTCAGFLGPTKVPSTNRGSDSFQEVPFASKFDEFGNLVSSTGSPQGPLGFNGQYGYQTDQDSGFQLLGHRYYDPSTGRFLTRDPAKDGQNWYDYCHNSPLQCIDDSGFSTNLLGLIWGLIKAGLLVWSRGQLPTISQSRSLRSLRKAPLLLSFLVRRPLIARTQRTVRFFSLLAQSIIPATGRGGNSQMVAWN